MHLTGRVSQTNLEDPGQGITEARMIILNQTDEYGQLPEI